MTDTSQLAPPGAFLPILQSDTLMTGHSGCDMGIKTAVTVAPDGTETPIYTRPGGYFYLILSTSTFDE